MRVSFAIDKIFMDTLHTEIDYIDSRITSFVPDARL